MALLLISPQVARVVGLVMCTVIDSPGSRSRAAQLTAPPLIEQFAERNPANPRAGLW